MKDNDTFFNRHWCMDCVLQQRQSAMDAVGSLYVYSLNPDDQYLKKTLEAEDDLQAIYDFAVDEARFLPSDVPIKPYILDALVTLGEKLDLDTSGVMW